MFCAQTGIQRSRRAHRRGHVVPAAERRREAQYSAPTVRSNVTQRKYAIFVYAWLETSAGPQQNQNELPFVTIDIDATVPYVVIEEQPL